MNVVFRFYAFLLLASVKADGSVFQPPNSTQRQPQRNESESDAAATDFLNEVVATILKDYPTNDLSKFAALINALLAHAPTSNDSTLHSNWSSTIDQSDVPFGDASEEEEEEAFDDVGNDYTPFPESSSMNADANVSIAFGNVTGSASGGLEHMIGDDATMRDGTNISNSAVVRLLSGMIVSIIALHAFTLAL